MHVWHLDSISRESTMDSHHTFYLSRVLPSKFVFIKKVNMIQKFIKRNVELLAYYFSVTYFDCRSLCLASCPLTVPILFIG